MHAETLHEYRIGVCMYVCMYVYVVTLIWQKPSLWDQCYIFCINVCVWEGVAISLCMYVCMYVCRKYERYINALFEAYSKQRRAPLPVILHRFAVYIVTRRPFNSICLILFHRKILERNLAKKSPCLSGVTNCRYLYVLLKMRF